MATGPDEWEEAVIYHLGEDERSVPLSAANPAHSNSSSYSTRYITITR